MSDITIRELHKCLNCGKETINKKYCSTNCYMNNNNPNKLKIVINKYLCLNCGKEFISHKNKLRKCCSRSCAREYQYKGKEVSKETRLKMSISHRGREVWNKGLPSNLQPRFGLKNNSIIFSNFTTKGLLSDKKGKTFVEMYGTNKAEEIIKKQRNKLLETYKTNPPKRINKLPTRPELVLKTALQEKFPNQWEYVGDGKIWVGGKNPDFSNNKGLFLEVYGDYWHKGENPQDRIDLFKQHGYECLVFWEHEVYKDINKVLLIVEESLCLKR